MERVLRLKLGRSLWHTLKDLDKEWKKKNSLQRTRADGLSKLKGYETFTDGLEIWSEGSQDTNLKKPRGAFPFFEMFISQWSPT